jgi:hypothetical protein
MMSNVTAKKWENLRSSIYIEGGGFDVKNCPNPLELAAKIVKCVNYHERLVEALTDLLEFEGSYSPCEIEMARAYAEAHKVLLEMQEPTQ